MADEKKVTIEDLQKQIDEVNTQIKTLTEENNSLKEQVSQKDLEIAKLTLGGVNKVVTKEVKEDEDVTFDFDF